jgi:hypothetical protein
MRTLALALVVACAAVSGGCRTRKAAKAAAAAVADPPRVLVVEGNDPVPIEGLDVFLNDDENVAETFHMHGAGFSLAGTLPSDLHVGYGSNWEVLKGQSANIEPSVEDHQSELGISRVTSGTISFEQVSRGEDGRSFVSGQVTLHLSDGRVVHGRFVARAKTWG